MSSFSDLKFRAVTALQHAIANPLMRRVPTQVLLETTGRVSGEPKHTPIGGSRIGDEFWFVSEYGRKSQYVRNIMANPRVRLRLRGQWHAGTATLLDEDDARARLATLPKANSAAVRMVGTELLTIRIDLITST
ncbi:MAG TPA: nitroreductase/quinone reductase family protein [Pseudonocardiaceae bacterium]|jgi:deazaflavin-dependent oxidoreductase (nitroreductase family)|nr:nitroreductase/quinone reductase family protein [Pseudonocardiaceae bacterium]